MRPSATTGVGIECSCGAVVWFAPPAVHQMLDFVCSECRGTVATADAAGAFLMEGVTLRTQPPEYEVRQIEA